MDKTLNTKLVILNSNNFNELKNNIQNESRNCNILLEKNQLKIINNKNEDKLKAYINSNIIDIIYPQYN